VLGFRFSVAAFYPWLVCLFYSFAGPLRRDRFPMFRLLLSIHSEVEKIVYWMPEILFAAEIAFRAEDSFRVTRTFRSATEAEAWLMSQQSLAEHQQRRTKLPDAISSLDSRQRV
jgi:hypothetical protein